MQLILNKKDYSSAAKAIRDFVPYLNIEFFLKSFQSTSEVPQFQHIDDKDLSQMCMVLSEQSFMKVWANEDDAKWEKFLND